MDVYEAIAEPNRRRIVEMVGVREHTAGEIGEALNISQPGASKHLRILREAGLLGVRKDAQRRVYRLNPDKLAEVDAWLQQYRRYWSGRLDALEAHLHREV